MRPLSHKPFLLRNKRQCWCFGIKHFPQLRARDLERSLFSLRFLVLFSSLSLSLNAEQISSHSITNTRGTGRYLIRSFPPHPALCFPAALGPVMKHPRSGQTKKSEATNRELKWAIDFDVSDIHHNRGRARVRSLRKNRAEAALPIPSIRSVVCASVLLAPITFPS